jgi:hypothetical protein
MEDSMAQEEEKPYLDIKRGRNQYRRYYFETEAEKREWEKMHRKSKLYIPYFLFGIALNFGLYFAGVDLKSNILTGALVGLGVPLACMYVLSELHFRIAQKLKNSAT